jgi:hypothetical protein
MLLSDMQFSSVPRVVPEARSGGGSFSHEPAEAYRAGFSEFATAW